MANNEKIKTFVRQTLGCICPEELFKHIECKSNIKLDNNIILNSKINIGNKLLIYVLDVYNPDSIKSILPYLVNRGKKERDSLKFNRFRLVLATDNLDKIKRVADVIFKTIDKDEKIHLHIVPKDNMPIFSNAYFYQ